MLSLLIKSLLLFLVIISVDANDDNNVKCTPGLTSLDTDFGTLEIPASGTCGYITGENRTLLAIKTDHMNFNAGDSVVFETIIEPKISKTLTPPVINGYIISGEVRAQVKFNFAAKNSSETLKAEYSQNQNLTINANLINDFYIEPVSLTRLPVKVVKTLPQPVLLEVIGAKINNKTNHMLITDPQTLLNISVEHDQLFRVTTSPLFADEVVAVAGSLNKIPSTSGDFTYLLQPGSQQFAAIQVAKTPSASINVTIYKAKEEIATFASGSLPPVVAIDEPDVPMIVKLSGKDLNKLNSLITFKSLPTNCNRIITQSSDHFSVYGAQPESCVFTLASKDEVTLSIDYNDLTPDGCLVIQPLSQDDPIYNNCNMDQTMVLPNFVLKQAFVKVTLKSNKTFLEASIKPSHLISYSKVELASKVYITSSNYPASYEWITGDQTCSMNATGKSYILSAVDIDLRKGEKLMAGTAEVTNNTRILGDLDVSNKVTNITIKRQPPYNDFALHKGFKLVASQFQSVVVANMATNKTATSNNVTSVYVKISSPPVKANSFGKRIAYSFNFSSSSSDYELSVIDGRSIYGLQITDEQAKYHGSSTSDTLLIVCRSKKPNVKIPVLTIEHSTLECNKTSDVICDMNTRCVPKDKLCKGKRYCDDGADLRYQFCSPGVVPEPEIIHKGFSGITVFIVSVLMLTFGAVIALYGPDLLGNRLAFLGGNRYSTFTSSE